MISPYLFRLMCLVLAAFFLVHLVVGVIVSLIAPAAVRMTERIRPSLAARALLALRLFPAGFAIVVVAALCVPSYLWLEPEVIAEHIGFGCLTAAVLGAAIWGVAIARGLRATARSLRYVRNCQRAATKTQFRGDVPPVWVVEGAAPLLALAGVIHPRLVVSREVVSALSADQLAAALRHECAHRVSRDNLKRLFLLLAPDMLPFFRGFRALERGWARFTEWAADDRAVGGDARRSVSLAAALVRVARLGAAVAPSPLMTSLLADSRDLSARVERLLRAAPPETPARGMRVWVTSASVAAAGALMIALWRPATLSWVHGLLESLMT